MSAGSRFEYLWADGVTVTKVGFFASGQQEGNVLSDTPRMQPIKVSAPEYVDLLMTWVEGQVRIS